MMSTSNKTTFQMLENNSQENVLFYEKIISSTIGSILTSIVVTPFDVVKTRIQVQEQSDAYHKFAGSLKKGIHGNMHETTIKGMVDGFIKIPQKEGFTSLWSGLVPTLTIYVPSNAIYYTMYDGFCEKLSSDTIVPQNLIPLIAGVLARSSLQALNNLVKNKGWKSLWHGWGPTIYRDTLFSGLFWSMYEQMKKKSDDATLLKKFSYSAVSGLVSATLTLPFDVVKTQRQAELGRKTILREIKSPSTFSLLSALYVKGGIKSLFAGAVPRLVKVAPACAIMTTAYETGKIYFEEQRVKLLNKDKT